MRGFHDWQAGAKAPLARSLAPRSSLIEKILVEWLRSKGYLASNGAKPTKGKPK
jgi:hypothetical protein